MARKTGAPGVLGLGAASALAVGLVCATACLTPAPRADGGAETGLRGTVMKGPMCPGPGRLGHPCPDKPVEAEFRVLGADGQVVATFRSDTEGRFEVSLPAGTYTVLPQGYDPGSSPIARSARVTVAERGMTEVRLHWDTGMR